jgi:hypothetical protein
MSRDSTKEAAEALLRELPSVIGACVREDVYGHPREIHLLVRSGPNPRHLAYDVRDLLEERLGIPVDQRVISIAQIAPGRESSIPVRGERSADSAVSEESGTAAPTDDPAEAKEPRIRFTGISTQSVGNRVSVRISLDLDGTDYTAEVTGLDTAAARLRACAAATLQAVDSTCVGRARFEVEQVSSVRAFERDYVLVTVLASSPYLGRGPIPLVGAQPIELDGESAVALASLKAVNRTLSLLLRLDGSSTARSRARARHT